MNKQTTFNATFNDLHYLMSEIFIIDTSKLLLLVASMCWKPASYCNKTKMMCFPLKQNPSFSLFRACWPPLVFCCGLCCGMEGAGAGTLPHGGGTLLLPAPKAERGCRPGSKIGFCIALPQPGLSGQLLPSNGAGPAVAGNQSAAVHGWIPAAAGGHSAPLL